MKIAIEKAIKVLCAKINSDVKSDDALKFTQAASNLAHAAQAWQEVKERKG
jgi:hypothetical protein